ncbi:integral membrane protein [Streptomyces sp. SPB074]|nr:integral membrane protein [Streptomyces sp. SPB074]
MSASPVSARRAGATGPHDERNDTARAPHRQARGEQFSGGPCRPRRIRGPGDHLSAHRRDRDPGRLPSLRREAGGPLGALAEIAEKPFGLFLLWALGIATAGMALWRLSEAAFGASGPDGDKAHKRLLSGGRAVFYGFVAYSVLSFAAGAGGTGSSDNKSKDVTATALGWPGGRWIVAVAGAVVVGAGVWILVRAVLRKFRKHLKTGEMGRRTERVVDVTGVAGGVARGVLFGTAGVFAVVAAVRFEPKKAKGMDDTLRSFTETPAGPWLLVVIAVGLLCFGCFSVASARYRET